MFGRKNVEIDVSKFNGVYDSVELEDSIMQQMLRGNNEINWHTVRKYVDCNYTADLICDKLNREHGSKISYLGKLFSKWL